MAETPTAQTASLEGIEGELLGAIAKAADLGALEEVRVAALGKKGRVSELMQTLGRMAPEERKSFGQAVNQLKDRVGEALERKREALGRAALSVRLAAERADVTLPVREGPLAEGRIHPVSQVADEITEIFADMGFSIAEGPDIETDFNNFTALNIPPEHPARQDHDTFYFAEGPDGTRPVLRTHTSPVQIRTMLARKPPLRIIAPGRVYRSDSDQTHTPMFHQVEGLAIDEETHLGHLKWVLEEFCKAFFEVPKVKMRFRASHFPFTEPSMEVDIGYAKVGDEIRIGEGDQWLEILGLRHGAPERAQECRARSRPLSGLRLRLGHRPHRHAEIRHARSPRLLLRGPPLAQALRLPLLRRADPRRRTWSAMKFTLAWLKEHLDTRASVAEIADTLTRIGLEVEEVFDPSTALAPFKVAKVLKAEKHPNADKLQICEVDTGTERLQVVCGAPNAREGLKGVFAPVGSYVPGIDLTLTKAKIRGVESNGMLLVRAGARALRRA